MGPAADDEISALTRLRGKLRDPDLAGLPLSAYTVHHLSRQLAEVERFLGLYADVLGLALSDHGTALNRVVLVDYGGGTGLMSLLAKELGVGMVVYNDVHEVSCRDLRLLSKEVGLEPDHIVCGDLDDVAAALSHERIAVDVMASYDVLEHIYDVEAHLRGLALLSDEPFRAVYASSANIENPRIVSAVEALQWEAEHEDRPKELEAAHRGTARAYLDVRREIIGRAAPGLDDQTLGRLARRTRGLIRADIEAAVVEYLETGAMSYRPDHPTNTCDPFTGDWCERLLRPDRLEEIARDAGYDAEIHAGTYPLTGSPLMRFLKRLTNIVIRALGRRALVMAPYYVLDIEVPAAEHRTRS